MVFFILWDIRFQFLFFLFFYQMHLIFATRKSSKAAPFFVLCVIDVCFLELSHFIFYKEHYFHIQSSIDRNKRMLSVPESTKPKFFLILLHRHPLRLGDIQHCARGWPAAGHAGVHRAALSSNKGRPRSCTSCRGRGLLSVRGETIYSS